MLSGWSNRGSLKHHVPEGGRLFARHLVALPLRECAALGR